MYAINEISLANILRRFYIFMYVNVTVIFKLILKLNLDNFIHLTKRLSVHLDK